MSGWIWKAAFPSRAVLENRIDLTAMAEKYDLPGGTIMNIVRYSSLKALSRANNVILLEDIEAIRTP